MRRGRIAVLAALGLFGGCGDFSGLRSTLRVNVIGLAPGTEPAITVMGADGYWFELTPRFMSVSVMRGGTTMTVRGAAVVANGAVLLPSPVTQTVSVGDAEQAVVTVTYATGTFGLAAQPVVSGLMSPVHLASPPNDTRLFIVEQPGRIRIVRNGVLLPTPFLDISSRVTSGGERGLLSFAFDPAYSTNGRFYVYYTGAQGDIFVDRHIVSANPDVAATAFQQVITIPHRFAANHNGGLVAFGPDGMLYLGTGDGGGGGDPENNAQNKDVLLGKILRLNVASLPYTIPPDNPFVNTAGADEVWDYGLRNPWRFTFDTATVPPRLYIADVGQNLYEEINVVTAVLGGRNFGWRLMEGLHCFTPATDCGLPGIWTPVLEYDHGPECSVTGGVVYRGAAMPLLHGHYFYSDFCAGWLRSFRLSSGSAAHRMDWSIGNIGNVLAFGTDGQGEMYLLSASGIVYRIVSK